MFNRLGNVFISNRRKMLDKNTGCGLWLLIEQKLE